MKDHERAAAAFAADPRWVAARKWLDGDRRHEIAGQLRVAVDLFQALEIDHPPDDYFAGVPLSQLPPSHPLAAMWPVPTEALRRLMFHAARMMKASATLIDHGGTDLTTSLQVLGRSLLEAVAQIRWVCQPWREIEGSPLSEDQALRSFAARVALLHLGGAADQWRESDQFQFDDLDAMAAQLDDVQRFVSRAFGAEAVDFSRTSAQNWKVGGESRPKITTMVEEAGADIYSGGVSPASHYTTPSLSAHASLGSDLGQYLEIDAGTHHYKAFTISPKAVEGWARYQVVWFRWAGELVSSVHGWPVADLAAADDAARAVFGGPISTH